MFNLRELQTQRALEVTPDLYEMFVIAGQGSVRPDKLASTIHSL